MLIILSIPPVEVQAWTFHHPKDRRLFQASSNVLLELVSTYAKNARKRNWTQPVIRYELVGTSFAIYTFKAYPDHSDRLSERRNMTKNRLHKHIAIWLVWTVGAVRRSSHLGLLLLLLFQGGGFLFSHIHSQQSRIPITAASLYSLSPTRIIPKQRHCVCTGINDLSPLLRLSRFRIPS